MKVFTVTIALLVVGCWVDGQGSEVISNDGSKDLGFCASNLWVKCVNEFCPDGYDIVRNGYPALIKCKAPAK